LHRLFFLSFSFLLIFKWIQGILCFSVIVIAIPNIVKVFFDPSNKALQIQDEKDFAFGVALGNIQNAFLTTFVSIQARYPNSEEIAEINNIISKRTPEIRNAISSVKLTYFDLIR
jgi:hypothetical protein